MAKIIILLVPVLLFSATEAHAIPLGLYEGLMANSGAALSQSKASSFYNPSLLRQREEESINLGGTSLTSMHSKENGNRVSSAFEFSPSYVSNIIVSETLVHELFIATTMQNQLSWSSANSTSQSLSADAYINRLVSGYSMAFQEFPLALQVLLRYSEMKMTGSSYTDITDAIYVVNTRAENKNLSLGLGISTHLNFSNYSLGVNFNSRGLSVFNQSSGNVKIYAQDPSDPSKIYIHEMPSDTSLINDESKLIIGHSFRIGVHEFLTDSSFDEKPEDLDRYYFSQSFGYRYGTTQGSQFLCGLAHRFGSEISYFTQNLTISAGYSWKTRQLRSAFGIFYNKDNALADSSLVALMFGSEYSY